MEGGEEDIKRLLWGVRDAIIDLLMEKSEKAKERGRKYCILTADNALNSVFGEILSLKKSANA